MANCPQQLELPPPRTYSRTEFTALRARVKGLPVATIARLYFDPEEHEVLDVERLLRTMRDDLVSIALHAACCAPGGDARPRAPARATAGSRGVGSPAAGGYLAACVSAHVRDAVGRGRHGDRGVAAGAGAWVAPDHHHLRECRAAAHAPGECEVSRSTCCRQNKTVGAKEQRDGDVLFPNGSPQVGLLRPSDEELAPHG